MMGIGQDHPRTSVVGRLPQRCFIAIVLLHCCVQFTRAEIYRWDDGTLIPGTEGLLPEPETSFAGLDLAFADLRGFDLTRADFSRSNLTSAHFESANVSGGDFTDAILNEANFVDTKLDGARLWRARLRTSDFTGATITGVGFSVYEQPSFTFIPNAAITKEQLYSTASYQQKELHGISFGWPGLDISGWDFSGQNLAGMSIGEANAAGADFSGANLSGARLNENYFGSANFDNAIFDGVDSEEDDFTNANLNGVDLSTASLEDINFSNVDLRNTLLPRHINDAYYSKWTVFPPGHEQIDCDRGSMWCRRRVVDGDYNDDSLLDVSDVDGLIQRINGMHEQPWLPEAMFDLAADTTIDVNDLHYWVSELKQTWIGDGNLDGEFNSTDFTEVFSRGKYESGEEANWSAGDWDGDMRFTTSDFIAAFEAGGYERGPRAAAVPEPVGGIAIAVLAILLSIRSASTNDKR